MDRLSGLLYPWPDSVTAEAPVRQQRKCQGCGIRVGPKRIEQVLYNVASRKICFWCIKNLMTTRELLLYPYDFENRLVLVRLGEQYFVSVARYPRRSLEKMVEERYFVTDDMWIREEGGQLDAADRELLDEVSQKGRYKVVVISVAAMLEYIKTANPGKFREFKEELEKQAGKPLSPEELAELSRKATARFFDEFANLVASMTPDQAARVRKWRVVERMTWRALARAAYTRGWFGCQWSPPSNQIMGMALADRAARHFKEDFRKEPWN